MPHTGRHGHAALHFGRRGPQTILLHRYTTLPARLIRPFYWDDSGRAYVYLLTPTGGMLGGDRLDLHVVLEPGAQVCLTTASATKVHPAVDVPAEQSLRLELGPGSSLEYLSEPTILFRDARWRQRTVVHRAADSQLLLMEAWSAGRVARGEIFEFTCLETAVEVYTAGHLVLYDRLHIRPAAYPHQHNGLWAGRPYLLSMYLLQETPPSPAWLQALQAQCAMNSTLAGLSALAAPGVVARALADDAEALTRVMWLLWQRIREDVWGERWHPWRKL
jgi:urease accessory protein